MSHTYSDMVSYETEGGTKRHRKRKNVAGMSLYPGGASNLDPEEEFEEYEPTSRAQCKLLVALVTAMATSQTTRQNTVSLLPTFVKQHHSKYNETDVGLLLCAY
jgi:hypothetical protein